MRQAGCVPVGDPMRPLAKAGIARDSLRMWREWLRWYAGLSWREKFGLARIRSI